MPTGGELREAPTSLRDSVTGSLRTMIVTGQLLPGDRLVERRLAEQLGVSRVPVREALRVLDREGFVEERPTRGMVVRRMDDDDVAMLFAVRAALESVLARRLVEVVDDAGLADLRADVERCAAHARHGRTTEAIAANAAFHARLVELADSPVLTTIIEPVAGRMAWLLGQHSDPGAMNDEHRLIVEALAGRDAEHAARVFAGHLDHSRTAAVERSRLTASAAGSPDAVDAVGVRG